jgi:hypothetical protein
VGCLHLKNIKVLIAIVSKQNKQVLLVRSLVPESRVHEQHIRPILASKALDAIKIYTLCRVFNYACDK